MAATAQLYDVDFGPRTPAPPRSGGTGMKAASTVAELWQRLRAMRQWAQLRQRDVAEKIGKSRSAVSLWESPDPHCRTEPSIDDIRAFARACNGPVGYLLDPNATSIDLLRYIKGEGGAAANEVMPRADVSAARRALLGLDDKAASAFWDAVEFHMGETSPDQKACFVRHANPYMPDFVRHGNGVVFAGDHAEPKAIVVQALSVLLHSEKLLGRALDQHVLIFAGSGGANINEREAERLWGVKIAQVDTLKQAVKYLGGL